MQWSGQQDSALSKISDWYNNSSEQVFRLFGYAGTGKTTLAQEIASSIGGAVSFAAPTGKAAHVLQTKGCEGAQTIHSLIYHPRDKDKTSLAELLKELAHLGEQVKEGKATQELYDRKKKEVDDERNNVSQPSFVLNLDSEVRYLDLLIVDECSMIDEIVGTDLLSFGTKVLVLGDPAQLPPVKGAGFFINEKPHFLLTEIHRQAQENPIIRMATDVRLGRTLSLGNYGESKIIKKDSLTPDMVLGADQVLVGRNATRHSYNNRIRKLLGRTQELPMVGDRLVCLQNTKEYGLLNGQQWDVADFNLVSDDVISLDIFQECADQHITVSAHTHHFRGVELPWYIKKDHAEFDYGYAMTCHKAQGSQWDDVMIFDESWCFKADSAKWLYTAITRAAEKLTLVKM